MNNKNSIPLDKGELIYESKRRRKSSYTAAAFFLLLGFIPFLYFFYYAFEYIYYGYFGFREILFYFGRYIIFAFAFIVPVFAYVFAASRLEIVSIFERRLDVRRGIFFRSHEVIWLYEIKDIKMTRNPIESLTRNSKIIIFTETGVFYFGGVTAEFKGKKESEAVMDELFEYLVNEVRMQRPIVKTFLT